MLFVTTRNKVDSFTAFHVLNHDRPSDGGFFVPLQLPVISPDLLANMTEKSFGQCVADVLNLFFRTELNGWDVDFCIGRQAVRLVHLGQKVIVTECWHNPERDFAHMVKNLIARLKGGRESDTPTCWAGICVRIATLFAVYAQLRRDSYLAEGQLLDICVDAEAFSLPMVGWYARKMGLPVGNIICSCRDNSTLWDFFRNGNLHFIPESRQLQTSLEPLIYGCFGRDEVTRYLQKSACNGVYSLQEVKRKQLCRGFYAYVIGENRITSVIHSVNATSSYHLDSQCALSYAAMQDHRTSEGESRVTLLLSQRQNRESNR